MKLKRSKDERRKMNRKLLKMTFKSEYKKREKFCFIDLVSVLLGICVSELVTRLIVIDAWIVNVVITTLITFAFITFFSKLRTRKNVNEIE